MLCSKDALTIAQIVPITSKDVPIRGDHAQSGWRSGSVSVGVQEQTGISESAQSAAQAIATRTSISGMDQTSVKLASKIFWLAYGKLLWKTPAGLQPSVK